MPERDTQAFRTIEKNIVAIMNTIPNHFVSPSKLSLPMFFSVTM